MENKHKSNDYSVVIILYLCVIVLTILLVRGIMNQNYSNNDKQNKPNNNINENIDNDINPPDENIDNDQDSDNIIDEPNDDVESPKNDTPQLDDNGIDSGLLDYIG